MEKIMNNDYSNHNNNNNDSHHPSSLKHTLIERGPQRHGVGAARHGHEASDLRRTVDQSNQTLVLMRLACFRILKVRLWKQ